MLRALKRFLAILGLSSEAVRHIGLALVGNRRAGHPPAAEADPYAWRPVPRTPTPKPRSGAVAVAEPDE